MRKSLLAVAVVLIGCGSSTTTTIGSRGGTVTADGGRVRLVFPPGALSGDTRITVEPTSSSGFADVLAGAAWHFGPDMKFARPVAVTLAHAGSPSGELRVAKLHPDGHVELQPNPSVDPAAHTASASLSGFSSYGVVLCPFGCPRPPSAIAASANPDGSVSVSWTVDGGGGAAGSYYLYRSEPGSRASFTYLGQVAATPPVPGGTQSGSYTDHPPCGHAVYTYQVRSFAIRTLTEPATSNAVFTTAGAGLCALVPDGGTGLPDAGAGAPDAGAPGPPPACRHDVTVSTLAGSGVQGTADGLGAAAQFQAPTGAVTDPSGLLLFVTDKGAIREIRTRDGNTTTLPISGAAAAGVYFSGITFDGAGNLVVAGGGGRYINALFRVPVAGGSSSWLTGNNSFTFMDGAPSVAVFGPMGDLGRDVSGNLYVPDEGFLRVRVVDSGGTSRTLAGSGASGFANGPAATATFGRPRFLAVGDGVVYVSDEVDQAIRAVAISDGTTSTLLGGNGNAVVDGPLATAKLGIARGLAFDAQNKVLYFVDPPFVRRILLTDGTVETVAGAWPPGDADGDGCVASFYTPFYLALGAGVLYVTESSGSTTGNYGLRVRAMTLPP